MRPEVFGQKVILVIFKIGCTASGRDLFHRGYSWCKLLSESYA